MRGLKSNIGIDSVPFVKYFSNMEQKDANTQLGMHIRNLRDARRLTLSDLSIATKLSRATLSRIENGEVSPTAEALGSLSTALEVSISQLLKPLERKFAPLVTREAQTIWADPKHDFKRRNISPPSRQLAMELIEVELGAKQDIKYASASIPGQEHHLYLLSGGLKVTVEGIDHELSAGDCLRYKLYGETTFQTGGSPAKYIIAFT